MATEHETYAAYLDSFKDRKALIAATERHNLIRAELRTLDIKEPIEGMSRVLEWTIRTYWPEIERVANMAATPKPGRGRPAKPNPLAQQLTLALDFVMAASSVDDENPERSYVRLANNFVIASNGQVSAGHPIAEDITACPHLAKLQAALKKCGKSLQITQTPSGQLSVKGDKLRATVPCYDPGIVANVAPEAPVAVIDDKLKTAFKACNSLVSEAATNVMFASVMLQAHSCAAILGFGTSAVGLIEAYHGIDLPPNIILPKVFTAAVAKAEAELSGFGFTWSELLERPSSVTFWFKNGSWIKTQCYSDKWTDIAALVGANNFPKEVPAGLFEGVEAVTPFSEDEVASVYFINDAVMSHPSQEQGANYPVPGLPGGKRFNAKLLNKMAPFVKLLDLTTYSDRAYFRGGEGDVPMRGVFMGMTGAVEAQAPRVEPEAVKTPDPEDATHWTPREGEPVGSELTGDPSDDIPGNYEIDDDVDPNVGWGH